jgi:DNA-binding CsgD family transcriptional regulator
LTAERSELEYEMEQREFPPMGWTPAPGELHRSPAGAVPSPPAVRGRTPTEILRPRLTDLEFQQYEWMEQRLPQVEIAKGLGITQAAVSSREKRLRARIDAIYVEQTGQPYHWTPIPKPQGGRRRRS